MKIVYVFLILIISISGCIESTKQKSNDTLIQSSEETQSIVQQEQKEVWNNTTSQETQQTAPTDEAKTSTQEIETSVEPSFSIEQYRLTEDSFGTYFCPGEKRLFMIDNNKIAWRYVPEGPLCSQKSCASSVFSSSGLNICWESEQSELNYYPINIYDTQTKELTTVNASKLVEDKEQFNANYLLDWVLKNNKIYFTYQWGNPYYYHSDRSGVSLYEYDLSTKKQTELTKTEQDGALSSFYSSDNILFLGSGTGPDTRQWINLDTNVLSNLSEIFDEQNEDVEPIFSKDETCYLVGQVGRSNDRTYVEYPWVYVSNGRFNLETGKGQKVDFCFEDYDEPYNDIACPALQQIPINENEVYYIPIDDDIRIYNYATDTERPSDLKFNPPHINYNECWGTDFFYDQEDHLLIWYEMSNGKYGYSEKASKLCVDSSNPIPRRLIHIFDLDTGYEKTINTCTVLDEKDLAYKCTNIYFTYDPDSNIIVWMGEEEKTVHRETVMQQDLYYAKIKK